MPDAPEGKPLKLVGKMEARREAKKSRMRASCEAGVSAMLADPIVRAGLELLDDLQASLFNYTHGDPVNTIRGQVLKSVGGIPACIAEGMGKGGYLDDKRKFYMTARGSAYESVVWLRAMGHRELANKCVDICKLIDSAIVADIDEETCGE